ncbi:MAG: hypothetical protein ABJF23_22105 [Bryobacteraceae bacterium]
MTVTLNLPPDVESALIAEAQAKGIPLDNLIRDLLLLHKPILDSEEISPEEWVREFKDWVHSHSRDTPLLSDDAVSREFIYRERGL